MTLTPEQMLMFRHNGYLKLPEPLPTGTVAGLKEAVRSNLENEIEPLVRDPDGRASRISDIYDRDEIFRQVIHSDLILDPLEGLLGPNIEFIKNRHNHATLRFTSDMAIHRDVFQWTRTICTVVVFLEDSTPENGATHLLPGSHLLPGFQSNRLKDTDWIAKSGVLDQMIQVPVPAGGMLAIDSMILHSPGVNHTAGSRTSMTLGYHSVDELSDVENPKCVLVRGERIYNGNDY